MFALNIIIFYIST